MLIKVYTKGINTTPTEISINRRPNDLISAQYAATRISMKAKTHMESRYGYFKFLLHKHCSPSLSLGAAASNFRHMGNDRYKQLEGKTPTRLADKEDIDTPMHA
jgi:hypothetical protein